MIKPNNCPFCGSSDIKVETDGHLHEIECDGCGVTGPVYDSHDKAVEAWNLRATQPAAGEPVAYIPAATMARLKPGMAVPATLFAPPIPEEHYGVPVFLAPPAAAHGDEAVQYRLLRVGEVIKATDELLMDDCTTWHPMGDGPQIGIGWGWHAGLMPVRRIDAAMRAQGDGEPS